MAFDPISRPPDRRALALLVLGLGPLGCADPRREEPRPSVEVQSAEASTEIAEPAPDELSAEERAAQERAAREAEAELRGWLSTQVVTMEDVFRDRPIVYTWTRAEQVDELRRTRRLLTRSRGPNGERGAFAGHLEGDPHPLARHLQHPSPRRFGWTNPWATRLGWSGDDYGDRLIAVELRADAWFATFDATAEGAERWRVTDLSGEEVSRGEVAAHPERVAAVLHVGRGVSPAGEPRVAREIVLVSESRIKRWTVGGDEVAQRLADDGRRLGALADFLEAADASEWAEGLWERWTTELPDDPSLVELYDRSLALGSPLVRPEPARVRALADALSVPTRPSLVQVVPDPRARRARRPRAAPSAPPPPPRGPRTTEIIT